MATYLELYDLQNNDTLHHKIYIAVVKKAQTLTDLATPTANQLTWANNALSNPRGMVAKILPYVLAANSGATTSQIAAASDAAVQTNVDATVDKLIAGGITS